MRRGRPRPPASETTELPRLFHTSWSRPAKVLASPRPSNSSSPMTWCSLSTGRSIDSRRTPEASRLRGSPSNRADLGPGYSTWLVGRYRTSLMSTSSGWLKAKATTRAKESAGTAYSS